MDDVIPILLPNLLWVAFPPREVKVRVDQVQGKRLKLLQAIETVARVAVFIVPFFYSIHASGMLGVSCGMAMFASLGLYCAGWLRYYAGGRRLGALFAPLLGIPAPLALARAVYFLAASVVLRSYLFAVVSFIFGLVHVGLSIREWTVVDGVA